MGSRYRTVKTVEHITSDGQVVELVEIPDNFVRRYPGDILHLVRRDDSLVRLAVEYYSDPEKWFIIAYANANKFLDPLDLPVGNYIRIPAPQKVAMI